MMKKLMCALVVLTAVPALAEDKQERQDVRVFVHGGASAVAPLPPLPPLPPVAPLAPPSFGIPAEVAAKIGLPQNLMQKVQDLTFEANDVLIGLEADLKRSQLNLERELRQTSPNEGTVKELVEKVGRAETAVRQNRVGLMVTIKKTLGPDYWQKLEAEMPMVMGGAYPRQLRIERRMVAPPAPAQERQEQDGKR
jgi:hypothetical protein